MSAPAAAFAKVIAFVERFLGPAQVGKGGFGLGRGYHWGVSGCYASATQDANPRDYCVLRLRGATLGELEGLEVKQELIRGLVELGCKPTRIDYAVDIRGQGLALVEQASDSAARGELCGARCWERRTSNKGRERTGDTFYAGKRGKHGSGRFVRIYDKGLQTQTEEAGAWVRLELEATDTIAEQLVAEFVEAADPLVSVLARALGAIEFRTVTGDKNRRRRPLVAWWAELVEGRHPTTTTAVRHKASLDSYARWFRLAVAGPLKTFADRLCVSEADLIAYLAHGAVESENAKASQVLRELRQEWGRRAG